MNILRALSRARFPIFTIAPLTCSPCCSVSSWSTRKIISLSLAGTNWSPLRNNRRFLRSSTWVIPFALPLWILQAISSQASPVVFPAFASHSLIQWLRIADGLAVSFRSTANTKAASLIPKQLFISHRVVDADSSVLLAGGAGVNVGISLFRASIRYSGPRWWIFPLEPLHDAARIYTLVVPLFLIASLVEFYFV